MSAHAVVRTEPACNKEGTSMRRYPKEKRDRLVHEVMETWRKYPSEYAAIRAVAAKGGVSAEILRQWLRAEQERQAAEQKRQADVSEALASAGAAIPKMQEWVNKLSHDIAVLAAERR